MAKDEGQSKDAAQPRVYKASEVHKRRAVKPADKQGEQPAVQPVAQPAARLDGESPGAVAAAEPAVAEPAGDGRAQARAGSADETQPIAGPTADGPQADAASGAASAANEPGSSDAPPADASDGKPKRRSVRKEAETDEPADGDGRARKKRPRVALQVLGILGAAVMAVLLMFVGYFVASRWFVYDDRASMQGTWFIDGTSVPITITEDAIILDAQTTYGYEVDTTAKTVTYRFGNKEGHGRYWFSSDRHYLVITDGEDYTMWSTMAEDLSRLTGDLMADLFGDGAPLPSSENAMVLSTTPTINLGSVQPTTTAGTPEEE